MSSGRSRGAIRSPEATIGPITGICQLGPGPTAKALHGALIQIRVLEADNDWAITVTDQELTPKNQAWAVRHANLRTEPIFCRGKTLMKHKLIVLFAAAVSLIGVRAYAHHSFAATYFEDQKVTVHGKLVQFLYRNPHSVSESTLGIGIHTRSFTSKLRTIRAKCKPGPSNGSPAATWAGKVGPA